MIKGVTENSRKLKLTARVASVHKPLLSASRCVNNGQCIWLSKGGGWMIQDTEAVTNEVEKLLWKHASKATFIPVYEERGVYNVYVKNAKIEERKETTVQGGELEALSKPLKDCTKEELEKQIARLKSSFRRLP